MNATHSVPNYSPPSGESRAAETVMVLPRHPLAFPALVAGVAVGCTLLVVTLLRWDSSGGAPPPTEALSDAPPYLSGVAPALPAATAVAPVNSDGALPAPTELIRESAPKPPVESAPPGKNPGGEASPRGPVFPPLPGVARLTGSIENMTPTVDTRHDSHRQGLH